MKIPKIILAIAFISFFISDVGAVGLGEVTLHSSLNEPLNAEIELLDIKGLTEPEILISIADRYDYNRLGIEPSPVLSTLSLKVTLRNNGTGFLKLFTSSVIKEPFLDLLLELHWPNGRLVREYTLLIDPPVFSDNSQSNNQKGVIHLPSKTPLPLSKSVSSNQSLASSQSKLSKKSINNVTSLRRNNVSNESRRNYKVKRNETLWEIAEATKHFKRQSVHQVMLAIQKKNPEAFLDNNINRLKKGSLLHLPTVQEIASIDKRNAPRNVHKQYLDWKGKKEQINISKRIKIVEKKKEIEVVDKLTILSKKNKSPGVDSDVSGASKEAKKLHDQVSLLNESLIKKERETVELKENIGELSQQIETLQRLIRLKDKQLQQLQDIHNQKQKNKKQASEKQTVVEDKTVSQSFSDFLFSNIIVVIALSLVLPFLGYFVYWFLTHRKSKTLDDSIESQHYDFSDEELSNNVLDENLQDGSLDVKEVVEQVKMYLINSRYVESIELLQESLEVFPDDKELLLLLVEVHAKNKDRNSFDSVKAQLKSNIDGDLPEKVTQLELLLVDSGSEDDALANNDELNFDVLDEDEKNKFSNTGENVNNQLPDFELPDVESDNAKLGAGNQNESDNAQENVIENLDEDLKIDLDERLNDDLLDDGLLEDVSDEIDEKLDLARAYIELGEKEGAQEILQEVISIGNEQQVEEAKKLL